MNPAPLTDYEARILSLRGQIGPEDPDRLIDGLLRLDTRGRQGITLYLSSTSGGSLAEAVKLADILNSLTSPVTAVGMGVLEGLGVGLLVLARKRLLLAGSILVTSMSLTKPSADRSTGFSASRETEGSVENLLLKHLLTFGPKGTSLHQILTCSGTSQPKILGAEEAVSVGLADQVLTKSPAKFIKNLYA